MEFASGRLQADINLVKQAVKIHGAALQYTTKAIQDNKDVVILAVGNKGLSLQYASDQLKNDFEVVNIACQSDNGKALLLASKELRENPELKKYMN